MRKADLIRHLILHRFHRVFYDLHGAPPAADLRAGIVRIGGEPLVIPRHWLAGDPARRYLATAMVDAWRLTTRDPVRCGAGCASAWGGALRLGRLGDVYYHGEFFLSYDGGEDPAWPESADGSPDPVADFLQPRLATAFSTFCGAGDTAPEESVRFLVEFAEGIAAEICARFAPLDVTSSLTWLAAESPEAIAHLWNRLADEPALGAEAAPLLAALRTPEDQAREQAHLAPFQPFARVAGFDATPVGVIAWLRQHGASRRLLARLRYLPLPVLRDIATEWGSNARIDYAGPVRWLAHFLSVLHAHRTTVVDEDRIRLAAMIAATAGLCGVPAPGAAATASDPRELGFMPCDGQHTGFARLCQDMVQSLAADNPATATALADTLVSELLGATDETLALMREHASAVHDWINRGEQQSRLRPIDVRPDWQALMRGQQRWHAQFERHRGHFPTVPSGPARPTDEERVTWSVPCEAFVVDAFRVVPLASNQDLWDEGHAQEHCVSGYTGMCRSGHSVLFSIREAASGERLGTAEFQPRAGLWRLVQFRGLRNLQLMTREGLAQAPYEAVVAELAGRVNDSGKWPPWLPLDVSGAGIHDHRHAPR